MSVTYLPDFLFDGHAIHEKRPLTIVNGKVKSFDVEPFAEVVPLEGMLAPGFIDVQVNGGGGVLFNHAPTVTTLKTMVDAHSQFGVTSLLPTVITSDVNVLMKAADAVSEALSRRLPGILGIHFEGPHISLAKKGIHNPEFIRRLSEEEMAVYSRKDLGIKVMTVAPETVSPDVIAQLVDAGVRVCLGHSNASFEQTQHAINSGASGFTHLFNAMSPLTSREPGVVGAALYHDQCWCGLIVDNLHVNPFTAAIAIKAKPRGKTFLVTDAMSTIGSNIDSFELDGRHIQLQSGQLTDSTGTLAGSALDMITAVNNTIDILNGDRILALQMASKFPAEYLQASQHLGTLHKGAKANFIHLLPKAGHFRVEQTWINGISAFK